MNARMVHRGPDDEGVYADGASGVALGARRLSIIDVAGGHQPLSNEDGSIWAVLNGEIYNHRTLQERLVAEGHTLASRTDTEVLVHLYEDFGDSLVHALEGMYAFAIWDTRRRRMLVARDRFGEKPLFYAATTSELAFASELTALRAGLEAEPEVDASAVDAFYVYGYVPGPQTIAKGVCQLPPGHLMVWDNDSRELVRHRYWRPPLFGSQSVDHMDAVAETEMLLERSLRGRMISDVPLGIFLSGGVDSTLIATLAARISQTPVKTFTVGYDVGEVGETLGARDVARAIGSDHHEVIISTSDLAASIPRVLGRMDHPVADPALVALHTVAQAARREITVAVGGEGADELFGGYPRYRWLARAERIASLVPAGTASSAARLINRLGPSSMARMGDVLTPSPTTSRHVDWVTDNRRFARAQVYGPRLRNSGLHGRRPEAYLEDRLPWGFPVAGAFMSLDQAQWLPDDVLQKADRATMLTSLEMRTPFLSRELAELAASIPLSVHMRGGGKYVLRQVLKRTGVGLPSSRKRAFRVPLKDWLRGPLVPLVREQLTSSAAYSEGWFDRSHTQQLFEAHEGGRADNSALLWPIITFSSWLDAWRAT